MGKLPRARQRSRYLRRERHASLARHSSVLAVGIFCCKILISNASILVQLEKFAGYFIGRRVSLNQRVPGSSAGAPTKSFKHLAADP
jgi:hypothetical protein